MAERAIEARPSSSRLLQALVLCLVAAMLLAAGFAAGAATTWVVGPSVRRVITASVPSAGPEVQASREERLEMIWDVWAILEREYVWPERLDDDRMIYGAISGLVRAVGDPHTSFVEPLPAAIMDEDMSGTFEGIGATVDMVDGRLRIVRPLPESPALRAGLRANDIILAVDGIPLEGMELLEAISLIRGPEGTTVVLLVEREGLDEPFTVAIVRAKVDLPIIEAEMRDDGIAYLALSEFNALSQRRVHRALEELMSQEPIGLILDLRGNPGGYMQSAIDIASEFLPKDTLILTEDARDKPRREYRASNRGVALDVPLVVLIDGNSASASEIVAGALRAHGRATLIGDPTFGKGSVQQPHKLEDGSTLRVTIAVWNLPDGHHLEGQGIEPDILVERTPDDYDQDRDPQLDRAVEYLLSGE